MVATDNSAFVIDIAIPQILPFNHAANVLILLFTYNTGPSGPPASVTIGGQAMALEGHQAQAFGDYTCWSTFRQPAALENIQVNWNAGVWNHYAVVVSLLNTLMAAYYDATAANLGIGVNLTVNLPAGTANRRIIQGVQWDGTMGPNVWTAGQTQIIATGVVNVGAIGFLDSAALQVLTCTAPGGLWYTFAFGVIDITQDLLWKRRREHGWINT